MTTLTKVVSKEVEKQREITDQNGNKILQTYMAVETSTVPLTEEESAELQAEWANNEEEAKRVAYLHERKRAYPSIEDQFDILYHKGYDAWKKVIGEVKEKYPKPA